ncbi:putative Ig domain-containing protein [Ideonella sp.]|uniref:putative Ig domain-containing protein n=1 Tax=Ideonella sp. TaxID=1929293 RepID=UPI0035B2E113
MTARLSRHAPRRWAWGLLAAGLAVGWGFLLGAGEGWAAAASAPAPAASAAASSSAPASAPAATAPAPSAAASTVAAVASAPAATAAAPASAAASATTAQTSPVKPAASSPAVWLPSGGLCIPDIKDPDRCGPLTLERDPVTLPNASVGRPYARPIRAEGGLPPYRFDLLQGNLPGGLALTVQGQLLGTPEQAGGSRFRVRVVDAAGDVASQTYSLRVTDPAKATAKPAAKPASAASAAQLSQLDLSHAGPPAHAAPTAHVYQLETAQLDALKTAIKSAEPPIETLPPDPAAPPEAAPEPAAAASAPTPPPPATLVWSDAQQTQLEALLKPVFLVEYPTQSQFEAAVDAQVCAQAWQLIVHEAQRLKQQPPSQAEFAAVCPSPEEPSSAKDTAKALAPPAPPASAASGAAAAGMAQPVSWRKLPAWLMPPGLRAWLVEAAGRDRALEPTQVLPWKATASCNCATPRPQQPLYAVYPAWLAGGKQPQTIDFSLVNRISYFALPLGDDQAVDKVANWNEDQTKFIRTALAHETRVDFGIYSADWRFLATEPTTARDALIEHFTSEVPRRAHELVDTPLPGLASRAKAWLPGFGQVQRMGNGFTVFFDRLPDAKSEPELAARFADFYPRFVKGLAQALAESPERHYAINLVMTDQQIADKTGPFDVGRLFELLKAVEVPDMAEGRIVETNGDYKRNSNAELRFLVLLTEPTTQSKKRLRATIEASPGLFGGDRRIFLRSVVPLLMLPQASPEQYRDDLVYVQDNFGGIGFWPAPLMGQQFDTEQQKALRNTFDPPTGSGVSEALCSVVCPNRWLFRLAFELFLLLGAVCWLLLQWNCEWRALYGRYALLGALPPLFVGAALLQCDPALESLRKGNAQLVALIVIPLIAALWALFKRKEDKP